MGAGSTVTLRAPEMMERAVRRIFRPEVLQSGPAIQQWCFEARNARS